jgi:hydrogenase maturation protein HypF
LAGVRQVITYEAQAAIELEALAAAGETSAYHFDYDGSQFDAAPLINAAAADALAGISPQIISARFHNSLAALILEISLEQRRKTGLNQVALSGGVFQNVTLLESAVQRLEWANFEVFVHHKVPPNDGGLALGQAIIAAANSVE